MHYRNPNRRRRAFTLIELLLVIAIVALLIGILLPALGEARRAARTGICLSNMKQMATATQSYASDFQDRIFTFTWRKGNADSEWPDLRNAGDNLQAAADQVVDIWRRRADRTDIQRITGWIPHVYYSHVVLQDYLAQRLPEPMVACSEDIHRLNWQFDPINQHDKGFWQPFQNPQSGGVSNTFKRWPYSSSYRPVGPAYDHSPIPFRMRFINHMTMSVNRPMLRLGNLRLSHVAFPSGKVHMFDQESRHFGRRNYYYAHLPARQPLQMFDGSVNIQATTDANEGQDPNAPQLRFNYTYGPPRTWEAPTLEGGPSDVILARWAWTRGGLRGVDFGPNEAPPER